MKAIALSFFFFAGMLMGCKKERDPEIDRTSPKVPKLGDTIRPLPYFPAFPGSWWNYLNNAGDTIRYYTEPQWQKDAYSVPLSNGTGMYHSDTVIVPVYFETSRIPVWGASWNLGGNYGSLFPVVSEDLALRVRWTAFKGGTHNSISGEVIAKDTAVSVSGVNYFPVICIEYRSLLDSYASPPLSWRYFARNVGMVLKIENGDTLRLVSYHIGK
jgi:hypothetical protein